MESKKMTSFKTAGVVGLGNMGRGMALSLTRAGFNVVGFDSSAGATAAAVEAGIAVTASMAELGQHCDAIVLSLPNSAIVKSVLFGDDTKGGLAAAIRAGAVLIDTTTADPKSTRNNAPALAERGIKFIDAPVSGGAAGALKGELTMFIGGNAADVELATPLLAALGTKRFYIGEVGAGHTAKLINNLMVASHLLVASEAFHLSEAAGVPIAQIIEAINAGSGRSGVTQYNYPSRIMNDAFNSGFTMQLMRKDVNLAIELMNQVGVDLPVVREVGTRWKNSADTLADGEDFNRITQLH
ncbi:NAD(P)-dependent oxidoreductase [Herbaspirillum lusitanum]|uniref:NAD(P)-dependent oxidoreductase n=1 Tax=Herbaspirillum lusitanum TaxID=213312 RepID=A0ABW9AGD7_9BURK